MKVLTLNVLRQIANIFIWAGLVIGVLSFFISLTDIFSFYNFLLTLAGVIERTAMTMGVGAILLVLSEIVEYLRSNKGGGPRA